MSLEQAIGELENGYAIAYGSGLAAVAGILDTVSIQLGRPLRVLMPRSSYSGTVGQLIMRQNGMGWSVSFSESLETQSLINEIQNVDLVWLESPSNPQLAIFDIARIASKAKERGALVCVDNTFATPILQNPLNLGADLVVHSATKYLSGHSDVLGGAVVANNADMLGRLREHRTSFGSILGSMEAYLILRGIRTLHLRVERASANALELAKFLSNQPGIEAVYYPFLPSSPYFELSKLQMSSGGAMLSFDVGPSPFAAELVCSSLSIAVNSTSLGGVETQVDRRARYLGETIGEGFIRVSVGVENIDDLIADFTFALGQLRPAG